MRNLSTAMADTGRRLVDQSLGRPSVGGPGALSWMDSAMPQPWPRRPRVPSEPLGTELLDLAFGLSRSPVDPLLYSLQMLEGSALLGSMLRVRGASSRALANKLRAYRGFRQAAHRLDLDGTEAPLEVLIDRALADGAYDGIWTLEGLGFACSEHAGRRARRPRSLFRDPAPPLRARIPLHTGMGLSLAHRALGEALAQQPRQLATALKQFLDLCEGLSSPGCALMAFEGLGLWVRQLYPHRLLDLDSLLGAVGPRLQGALWHGVGRALFFTPSRLLDGGSRALAEAQSLAPHTNGRRNTLAGLAWATTLVNIRHPHVLAHWLAQHRAAVMDVPAFSHGVSSALLVWRTTYGEDRWIRGMVDYRPEVSVLPTWRQWVREPIGAALSTWDQLVRQGELASLFWCPHGGLSASPSQPTQPSHNASPGPWLDAQVSRWVDAFSRAYDGATRQAPNLRQRAERRT